MKTLTITEGRGRLGFWLKKAVAGEDVGFVVGDKIVALRPVTIHSDDYALQEYGMTEAAMKGAERRIEKSVTKERRRRTVKPFTGEAGALHDLDDEALPLGGEGPRSGSGAGVGANSIGLRPCSPARRTGHPQARAESV